MERWIAIGVAGLALMVSLFNLWTFKGIDARLDALEKVGPPPAPVAVAARAPKAGGAVAAPRPARRAKKVDLKDPETREAARERLAELTTEKRALRADKAAQARAELTTEVQAFGDEEGLDEDTIGRVLGLLEARSDLFLAVREDVRSGAISRADARLELKAELEASDAELQDLLGPELFDVLDQRLWADGRQR